MATKRIMGFDWGTTSSTDGSSGTFTIQNAITHSAGYAVRCTPTTTGLGYILVNGVSGNGSVNTNMATTSLFARGYVQFVTLPSADEIFYMIHAASTVVVIKLTISSTGVVKAIDNGGNVLYTSSALATGVWHHFAVEVNTGAAGAYNLYLDNALVSTGTGSFNTAVIIASRLGKGIDTNGSGFDIVHDDYIHSITSATFSMTAPSGQALLIATANGATMQWTGGTNTSDWTQVVAIPQATSTYVASTGAANDLALFKFQDPLSSGFGYGKINSVEIFSRGRNNTATTNATFCRTSSNGVTSDTTTQNLGTGEKTQMGNILDTDPNTTVAWALAGVQAVQGGSKENNAQITRMESVYLLVDFERYPAVPSLML